MHKIVDVECGVLQSAMSKVALPYFVRHKTLFLSAGSMQRVVLMAAFRGFPSSQRLKPPSRLALHMRGVFRICCTHSQ